ncbi:MAG: hypothetical protein DRJ03_24315 [Chloroflexi bacterium]|nr:MAG: hypothetical protein DRJ03_24315 [Chloroflexota bacterium]
MYLADIQPLDSRNSARIMVGYHEDASEPSVDEVQTFVVQKFQGRVEPVARSAARHPDVNGFSIVVQAFAPRRPIVDAETMIKVTGSIYTDAENVFWDVETDEGGNTFLARRQEASLMDILNSNKAAASFKNASFASSKVAAAVVYAGDTVKCYSQGQLYVGTVTEVRGTDMLLQPRQGGAIKASTTEIISVESRTAELDNSTKQKLYEYYVKAFGSEPYARELVYGK